MTLYQYQQFLLSMMRRVFIEFLLFLHSTSCLTILYSAREILLLFLLPAILTAIPPAISIAFSAIPTAILGKRTHAVFDSESSSDDENE